MASLNSFDPTFGSHDAKMMLKKRLKQQKKDAQPQNDAK